MWVGVKPCWLGPSLNGNTYDVVVLGIEGVRVSVRNAYDEYDSWLHGLAVGIAIRSSQEGSDVCLLR